MTESRLNQIIEEVTARTLTGNEGLKESYVSREYLDSRLAQVETRLIVWIVTTVGLGTFINHWWR